MRQFCGFLKTWQNQKIQDHGVFSETMMLFPRGMMSCSKPFSDDLCPGHPTSFIAVASIVLMSGLGGWLPPVSALVANDYSPQSVTFSNSISFHTSLNTPYKTLNFLFTRSSRARDTCQYVTQDCKNMSTRSVRLTTRLHSNKAPITPGNDSV